MRSQGRKPECLRPISIERNYLKHPAGSALVAFGDTKVVCTAVFERKVPAWMRDNSGGWVTAEYSMLPGSAKERIRREAAQKGRAQEISRLIGRSLRAVVDLKAMGECQLIVDCDVLQADGGTRTAAITGAFVATYDAFRGSVRAGNLPQMPLKGFCAAVSVGVVRGDCLLDLDYEEDLAAEVDLNLVMNDSGGIIEVQGTAEGAAYSRDELNRMLDLGHRGIEELIEHQRSVLEHAG